MEICLKLKQLQFKLKKTNVIQTPTFNNQNTIFYLIRLRLANPRHQKGFEIQRLKPNKQTNV